MIEKIRSIINKIGNTKTISGGDGIFFKIEGENPAGSIKDRVAAYILLNAIKSEKVDKRKKVVEATSGNTGIGLAYVCQELGVRCDIYMPESMSEKRRTCIAKYGARVVLTPVSEGMSGSVKRALEECKRTGGFFADQFNNPASIQAHYETTAKEIFSERQYDYVVCGIGTGGTIMGIKKYIRKHNLNCKVVGIEPKQSPLLTEGKAGRHKIEGIGANFIPSILNIEDVDRILLVDDQEAVETVKDIYKQFGIKCGISTAASYIGATQLREEGKKNILVICPDNGDRYPEELYN